MKVDGLFMKVEGLFEAESMLEYSTVSDLPSSNLESSMDNLTNLY